MQRTEICERIFNAGAARLVLLRAPASSTTVMLQVRRRFEETELPQASSTLDRADNDVGRFLAALTASLEPLIPALRKLQPLDGQGRTNWPSP